MNCKVRSRQLQFEAYLCLLYNDCVYYSNVLILTLNFMSVIANFNSFSPAGQNIYTFTNSVEPDEMAHNDEMANSVDPGIDYDSAKTKWQIV